MLWVSLNPLLTMTYYVNCWWHLLNWQSEYSKAHHPRYPSTTPSPPESPASAWQREVKLRRSPLLPWIHPNLNWLLLKVVSSLVTSLLSSQSNEANLWPEQKTRFLNMKYDSRNWILFRAPQGECLSPPTSLLGLPEQAKCLQEPHSRRGGPGPQTAQNRQAAGMWGGRAPPHVVSHVGLASYSPWRSYKP